MATQADDIEELRRIAMEPFEAPTSAKGAKPTSAEPDTEELRRIAHPDEPVQAEKKPESLRDTLFPEGGWGLRKAAQELAFGPESNAPTVSSVIAMAGPNGLNEEQQKIADSVEDPEEIAKFPKWHPKTDTQKEIAYQHWRNSSFNADAWKGIKEQGVGLAGLVESIPAGLGKAVYDVAGNTGESGLKYLHAKTDEEKELIAKEWATRMANVPLAVPAEAAEVANQMSKWVERGVGEAGFGFLDKALSHFGRSEETIKKHWMARDALDTHDALVEQQKPNILARAAEKAYKGLISFTSPSIDEILYAHPEFKGDRVKAEKFKNGLDEQKTQEAIGSYLDWWNKHPTDPDIRGVVALGIAPEIAGVELPAINVFTASEAIASGALELGNVARRLSAGATEASWARLARMRAYQGVKKGVEDASEVGAVGRGADALAGGIDKITGAIKKGKEYLDENIPEPLQPYLQRLGPYTAAGTVGGLVEAYNDPEHAWTSFFKGALKGELAAAAIKTPRLVADLAKSRAKGFGGTTGMWEGLNAVEDAGPMSRMFAAHPEKLDWLTNHAKDFAKGAIRITPMAATIGVLDSEDTSSFVGSMLQGWAWSAGPQMWHKMLGKDPIELARNQKEHDHQAFKLRASLDPAQVGRFDMFANPKTEVDASKQHLDAVTGEFQRAETEGANDETLNNLREKLVKAKIRHESAKEVAEDPKAAAEYSRMVWHQLAAIDSHISGSLQAGKNLKVNLLSENEIYDRLKASNKEHIDSLAGPDPTQLSDAQAKYLDLLRFYSTSEGVAYLRAHTVPKNGERLDKATGERVLFEPQADKDTIVLNADAIRQNMVEEGNAFLTALSHEAGHVIDGMQEYRDRTAAMREKLFGSVYRNASGEVYADTTNDAIWNKKALLALFNSKYAASSHDYTPDQVAEKMGHWNPDTGEMDVNGIAERMKNEVMADYNSIGLFRKFYANRPKGADALLDWLGIKNQNGRVAKALRAATGVDPDHAVYGPRSGAEFTPDMQEQTRKHLDEVRKLQGLLSPHNPEESARAPLTKEQILANKELTDYYFTDSGRFKTEMVGQVYDAANRKVSEVILTDPNVSEGTWVHHPDTAGESTLTQTRGKGEIPAELQNVVVPVGGHMMSVHRIARDPSGRPIENDNKATREMLERRAQMIRDAIDNSGDLGAPNRMRPISENSTSYTGTLSDAQIAAIDALPNRVVPQSIKDKLFALNAAVAAGDGRRLLIDYASRIDAKGRYFPFSPKIVDVTPIGMQFSNDGHFLARVVSISRLNSKADRWSAFMPARMKMWGGDKHAFVRELMEKYLANHSKGIEGSGWRETPEGPVKTAGALSDDYKTAIQKRDIFNDFMNMYDSATQDRNPNRTVLPKLKLTKEQQADEAMLKLSKEQKAAEKSSDQNTMIRSLRLDAMLDYTNTDLPKIPVDYYKIKTNFSLGRPPEEQERRTFDLPLFSVKRTKPQEEERRFFFTTSTERDPVIAKLVQGGKEKEIERINENSILHAMTGLKDIGIKVEHVRGVYNGGQEVSAITTIKAGKGADLDAARSRFVDLSKVFKQEAIIEEKMNGGKKELRGQVDADGFSHIDKVAITFKKVDPKILESARKEAGIDGMTVAKDRVEIFNNKNEDDFTQKYERFLTLLKDAGAVTSGAEQNIAAVRVYSEAPERIAGSIGYNDPSVHIQTERGAGGAEYGRLNTSLSRKLAEMGAIPPPSEGKRSYFEPKDVTKQQAKFQAEIAKVFDTLPDNDMQRGLTQRAYAALARDIKGQYEILTSGPDGMKFVSRPYSEGGEPYKNSEEAIRDIRENNQLTFLKTDPDAFGPAGADFSGHPLLADSGLKDANGVPLLYNDLFRAVHDSIAHGMFGSSFGPIGEEAAYHVHVRTLKDPMARWALMTETRGQNSWVNYRPEMLKKNGMPIQRGEEGYVPLQDRGFAVQKAALLPLEYALTGDTEVDKPVVALMNQLGTFTRGSRAATKQEAAIEARLKKGVLAEQKEASEFVKGAKGVITDSIFVDGNDKVKTSVDDTEDVFLMNLGVRPLPNIEVVKEKGQKNATPKDLLKLAENPEKYQRFASTLIASADKLTADPAKFASPKGYSEFMRENGVTGTILAPPSMLKVLIERPQEYLDLLTGGFHEGKTVKGGWEAANGGLNGVMEMRQLCGPDGPPPFITALHHLWGTLSKQLPPLDQEACWLRLISDRRVLDAIQSSIDGTFNPLKAGWEDIVASRLEETNNESTQKFGNNAKSNANTFILMLGRHNGKWDEVSNLYKTDDPAVMRTQFWGLNHGASGIKNKVQGFIGLTFGVKAAVLDRWRWVELHLPMAMKLAGKATPKEYFDYTGQNKDTPEDPTGIYKCYGTAENGHPAFSTALYTGLERVTNAAINNYAPLKEYLGAHADAGGLHWHVWNAIKNESVGHSSLDLTKSYLQQYGRNITPESFHQHLMNSNAYVEGENQGQIVRLVMSNGEFKVERQ